MDIIRFGYGYAGETRSKFDEALQHTKDLLAQHGFGVQAEINLSGALQAKLGVQVPREIILGVCNPRLAYRAMQEDPHITVLLPCNVTVRETATGTHIAAANPQMLVEVTHHPGLAGIASEADEILLQVLAAL